MINTPRTDEFYDAWYEKYGLEGAEEEEIFEFARELERDLDEAHLHLDCVLLAFAHVKLREIGYERVKKAAFYLDRKRK